MKSKELQFTQKLYESEQITEPINRTFVYQVLNEHLSHCYEHCIVKGISYNEYANIIGHRTQWVSSMMDKIHDVLCRQPIIAKTYYSIHGKLPRYGTGKDAGRCLCEIDLLDVSMTIANACYYKNIITVEELVLILLINPEYAKTIRNIGPLTYQQLMKWFYSYNEITKINDVNKITLTEKTNLKRKYIIDRTKHTVVEISNDNIKTDITLICQHEWGNRKGDAISKEQFLYGICTQDTLMGEIQLWTNRFYNIIIE